MRARRHLGFGSACRSPTRGRRCPTLPSCRTIPSSTRTGSTGSRRLRALHPARRARFARRADPRHHRLHPLVRWRGGIDRRHRPAADPARHDHAPCAWPHRRRRPRHWRVIRHAPPPTKPARSAACPSRRLNSTPKRRPRLSAPGSRRSAIWRRGRWLTLPRALVPRQRPRCAVCSATRPARSIRASPRRRSPPNAARRAGCQHAACHPNPHRTGRRSDRGADRTRQGRAPFPRHLFAATA